MEKESKEQIKEKILDILNYENRTLNIRELSELLKKRYKISRSPPIIKKYVEELSKDGELIYEDGEKS